MRHHYLLLIDLALIAVATAFSLALRENFDISPERLADTLPYLLCTLASAAVFFPALGAHRHVWGFSNMSDYLRIVAATVATIISAVTLGFVFNRLDGVARALPLLQGLLTVFVLVGARVLARLGRRSSDASARPAVPVVSRCRTVLVVGVGDLGGLYLAAVSRHAPDRIRIAGFLDQDGRHIGRSVHGYPVLGAAQDVVELMRDLQLHGVFVDAIVVAEEFDALPSSAQSALLELEAESDLPLEFLVDRLGLADGPMEPSSLDDGDGASETFSLDPRELETAMSRPYWRIKRVLDVIGAIVLAIVLAPLMALGTALTIIDVGCPPTFWQQRPGRYGRPFKLYKLRTMAAAHDAEGRRVPDELRVSKLGTLSRRLRLDELPQLINILIGEMSFIGPRPLLPIDQPRDGAARLVIRPGLTGWAQVIGGRAISAADKAALDIWYVRNASLTLDVEIALRTILVVILGERIDGAAIRRAWRDLRQAGVCRATEETDIASPVFLTASEELA